MFQGADASFLWCESCVEILSAGIVSEIVFLLFPSEKRRRDKYLGFFRAQFVNI